MFFFNINILLFVHKKKKLETTLLSIHMTLCLALKVETLLIIKTFILPVWPSRGNMTTCERDDYLLLFYLPFLCAKRKVK